MAPDLSPVGDLAQLHIDTGSPTPATAQLDAAGEIDLATAPVLREKLLILLRDQSPALLVVDLAGVTFLDCAGISALVRVRNAAGEIGCQLRITYPQSFVRRVLEVTGLLGMLTAPVEQTGGRTPRADHLSGTEWTPEVAAQPTGAVVAA